MNDTVDLSTFHDRVAADVSRRGVQLGAELDHLTATAQDLRDANSSNRASIVEALSRRLDTVHDLLPVFLADLGYLQQSAQLTNGRRHDVFEDEPARLDFELLRDAAPAIVFAEHGCQRVKMVDTLLGTIGRVRGYVDRQSWRPEIVNRIPPRS